MDTILIYGSRGWIASQIIDHIYHKNIHFNIVEGQSRVDDINSLSKEIFKINPDIVICSIDRTGVKNLKNIENLQGVDTIYDNIRDNLYAPLNLASICERKNIYCVYIGTGCIYDGEKNKIFDEEDNPNFFGTNYSIVKGFTDRLMRQIPNLLNLRIRMPVGDEKHECNFLNEILSYKKFINKHNSITVLPSLMEHLIHLIQQRVVGTINFTNPDIITHNEILDIYKKELDPSFEYNNLNITEQNENLKAKISNTHLNTTKLLSLCPGVPNVKNAIENTINRYGQNLKINTNILITGGCGFIGSHMIKYLFDTYNNFRIINIDKLTYSGDIDNIPQNIRTSFRYKFYKGDICNENLILHILKYNKVDQIINFAAETHVDRSFDNKEVSNFTQTNIIGTATILKCIAKINKNIRLVHISTDEVYGDSDYSEKMKENDKLNPTNPYAASKAGAEFLVNSYIYSHEIDAVIVRCNNVYGPAQFPEKIIPKFCLQCLSNSYMTIHGDGLQKRSFIYISDVVEAINIIRKKSMSSEIYNIGVDEEITIKTVADMIHNIFEKKQQRIEFCEDRNYNDKRYYINSSKLMNLGWRPKVTFEKGLFFTSNWYKENFNNWVLKL